MTHSPIYLNGCGRGLPDGDVFARMQAHHRLEGQIGEPAAKAQAADALQSVRDSVATLIGASPDHTGFSTSTSAAWLSITAQMPLEGKRILVAPHEWWSNLKVLDRVTRTGGPQVEVLPPLDFANPDLRAWQNRIDDDVAAIFAPMVTSVTTLRYPVEAIGHLQRPAHTAFIIDAAQALGRTPVDVAKINCDALVGTTRKGTRGPSQTALFWMSPAFMARANMTIQAVEPFDFNTATRLGLGVAVDQVLARGVDTIEADVTALTDHIRASAARVGLACIDSAETTIGAATLAIPRTKADAISAALAADQITAKWAQPGAEEPHSAVDTTQNLPLRVSPHLYNTTAEIDRLFTAIAPHC